MYWERLHHLTLCTSGVGLMKLLAPEIFLGLRTGFKVYGVCGPFTDVLGIFTARKPGAWDTSYQR